MRLSVIREIWILSSMMGRPKAQSTYRGAGNAGLTTHILSIDAASSRLKNHAPLIKVTVISVSEVTTDVTVR
jgi:hypothetical protein